jgi:hypothetical protein
VMIAAGNSALFEAAHLTVQGKADHLRLHRAPSHQTKCACQQQASDAQSLRQGLYMGLRSMHAWVQDMKYCLQSFGRYETAAEAGRAYDIGRILFQEGKLPKLNYPKAEYLDGSGCFWASLELPGVLAESRCLRCERHKALATSGSSRRAPQAHGPVLCGTWPDRRVVP